MKRTFAIQTQVKENTNGAILDIPSTLILEHKTAQRLVDEFEAEWGIRPEAVVLPVTNCDGVQIRLDGLTAVESAAVVDGQPSYFLDAARYFIGQGIDLYLLMDPTLPFIKDSAMQIVDIVDDKSRQLCVCNDSTQKIAGALLGAALDTVVDVRQDVIASGVSEESAGDVIGVVLDIVDLWPMGGSEGRIEATCFCETCTAYFESEKPGLINEFRNFPNAWNLMLRATETGIEHISRITPSMDASDIIGLSRVKGFHTTFGDIGNADLTTKANQLLEYVRLRHKQTIGTCKTILDIALSVGDEHEADYQKYRRVLLMEGVDYSWTCGLILKQIDSDARNVRESLEARELVPVDEIWMDVRGGKGAGLSNIDYRAYMSSRTRYYTDAFFTFLANAQDVGARTNTGMARLQADMLGNMIKERGNKAVASKNDSSTALASIEPLKSSSSEGTGSGGMGGFVQPSSRRIGFIGLGLNEGTVGQLVSNTRIARGIADKS